MPTETDLPLRRDKTMIWDGVAQKRNTATGEYEDLDLTGSTIRLVARAEVGDEDPTPILSLVSGTPTAAGRIDADPDQVGNPGRYTVRVEAAATSDPADFPDDRTAYFPYEIELTEPTGEQTVLAQGYFRYAPDVR